MFCTTCVKLLCDTGSEINMILFFFQSEVILNGRAAEMWRWRTVHVITNTVQGGGGVKIKISRIYS